MSTQPLTLRLIQLHTYVYIVPPPAHRPPHSPSSLSSGRGSELTVDAAIRVSHSAGSGKCGYLWYTVSGASSPLLEGVVYLLIVCCNLVVKVA